MLTVADCISDNIWHWTLIQTELVSSALRNIFVFRPYKSNDALIPSPLLYNIVKPIVSNSFWTFFLLFLIAVRHVLLFLFLLEIDVFCAFTYIIHDKTLVKLSFLKTYDVNIFRGGGGFYHILCAIFKRRTCQNN